MKKLIIALFVSCSFVACDTTTPTPHTMLAESCHQDAEATCSGTKSCSACTNCKYCKHCSKDGGSCGVSR